MGLRVEQRTRAGERACGVPSSNGPSRGAPGRCHRWQRRWAPPGCVPACDHDPGDAANERGTNAGGRPPLPPMAAAAWAAPTPEGRVMAGFREGRYASNAREPASVHAASHPPTAHVGALQAVATRGNGGGRPPVACLLAITMPGMRRTKWARLPPPGVPGTRSPDVHVDGRSRPLPPVATAVGAPRLRRCLRSRSRGCGERKRDDCPPRGYPGRDRVTFTCRGAPGRCHRWQRRWAPPGCVGACDHDPGDATNERGTIAPPRGYPGRDRLTFM